jgi:translation initiation factor 2A
MQREEAPKGKVKTNQPTSTPTPNPTYQAKQRVIPGLPPQMAVKKVKPVKKDNPIEKAASSSPVSTNTSSNNVKPKLSGEDESKQATVFKVESAEDKEKRAKNIKKKLKQIEEIKDKQKAGVALNSDQVVFFFFF